ncbi:hypothetical protein [Neobacillus sp. D3-1R]|uniref:hypothetical protein n=1 Tax=Neobacillus sp. D3-1R TaxID=3445778 RepID=UPI003FA157DE
MSGKKFIVVLVLAFVFSALLSFLNINPVLIFILTFLLIFIFFNPRLVYFSNNLKEIEKFLIKNRKIPEYQLFYGAANHIEEDVREAIGKLLKNSILRSQFPTYETILALFNKDVEEAKRHIEKIKPLQYQLYYRAIILTEENQLEEARELVKRMNKLWMIEAVKVELAKKDDQPKIAEEHAKKAVSLARGLQKYVLAKTFERELGLKII